MRSGRIFSVFICVSRLICVLVPTGYCAPTTSTTPEYSEYDELKPDEFYAEEEEMNEIAIEGKIREDPRWGYVFSKIESIREMQKNMSTLEHEATCDQPKNSFWIDIFEDVFKLPQRKWSLFQKMRTLEVILDQLEELEEQEPDLKNVKLCDLDNKMICRNEKCECLDKDMITIDVPDNTPPEEEDDDNKKPGVGTGTPKTKKKCIFKKDGHCTSDREDCEEGYTCGRQCRSNRYVACSEGIIRRFCDNFYDGKNVTYQELDLTDGKKDSLYFTIGMRNPNCCKCLPTSWITADKKICRGGANKSTVTCYAPLLIVFSVILHIN